MYHRFNTGLGLLVLLIAGLLLTACGDSPSVTPSPVTIAGSSNGVPTADLSIARPTAGSPTPVAAQTSPVNSDVFKIRLSFPGTEETINGKMAKSFGEAVTRKTNGRIQFEYFPNSSVAGGDQLTAVNMVQSGKIEAVVSQASFYTTIDPMVEVLGYPFLFPSHQNALQFLKTDTGKNLLSGLEQYNFKNISLIDQGFRQVTNSKRAITTPANMAGMRVRIPQSNLYTRVFKALGAEPVTTNFSPELYKALQNKTLDGQDAPITFSWVNKYQEVQNYLTVLNYSWDPLLLNVSLSFWKTLPVELQKALTEAGNEVSTSFNSSIEADEQVILDQFRKAGVQITVLSAEQRQAFVSATRLIYSTLETQYGKDFLDKFLKVAQG